MILSFKVTPWEVSGEVDYNQLIKDFGTKKITPDLIFRIKEITGDLHPLIRRQIFFSHRDVDWLIDQYEKESNFFLYTGRGPSGDTHLGHLMPWIFTKWLQDKFNVPLWFQMTDDEKFYFKRNIELKESNFYARENALDVIALGFDEKKTHIFSNIEIASHLYPIAALFAKKITFSTAKAVFDFKHENNLGEIFYTCMQAVPAVLPSILVKKNIPCLIPHAIDQDPHFRVTRDVAPKLGYLKPSSIHCIFLPGLGKKTEKMSASIKESAIFTTDSPEDVRKKISNALTGGQATIKEQREKGGNPDICSVHKYYYCLFMWDEKEYKQNYEDCKAGRIICGDCKKDLINRINQFLQNHQKKREEARRKLEKFWVTSDKLEDISYIWKE
ncbi:MAG: tryptophan--tRNA ligase [Candidatus Helarchaeota archaeon]|nr:tryptophan--tRNA ligase [Candidatus Helarchaeota archaeon]